MASRRFRALATSCALILPSAMSWWRAWTAWLAAILRLVLVRRFNSVSFQAGAFYAATRATVGQNVTEFPVSQSTLRTHVDEKPENPEGIWLGGRDSNPDSLVQSQ